MKHWNSSHGKGKVPEIIEEEKEAPRCKDDSDDGIDREACSETEADTFDLVPGSGRFKLYVGVSADRRDGVVWFRHRFSMNEGRGSPTSFARR